MTTNRKKKTSQSKENPRTPNHQRKRGQDFVTRVKDLGSDKGRYGGIIVTRTPIVDQTTIDVKRKTRERFKDQKPKPKTGIVRRVLGKIFKGKKK